jgi:DNA-directed RNA polymerase sigma subunit (sigma70/sigma32)
MSPESASQRPGEHRQATRPSQETSLSELEALAVEVGQVLPLRPGEQPTLLDRIRRGPDEAAVARLLETHLGMVLDLSHTKKGRGLTIGDLFQEGSVGLLAAIRAFPAAGDAEFETFSSAQVALAMEDAIAAETESVRQERLLIDAAADYDRVELALAREFQRAPSVAEIGTKLEWSAERTEQVRAIVAEARRRHDEELLLYVEPEEVTDLLGGEEFGSN